MPLTSSLSTKSVIKEFSDRYTFEKGERYQWSPITKTICLPDDDNRPKSEQLWSLLHEIGHAESGHQSYEKDVELIACEAEAWQWAESYAAKHDQDILPNYIEDCLDSYRDWLHIRSKCPGCNTTGLEHSGQYRCYNCLRVWRVAQSPLCTISKRSVKTPPAV